MEAMLSYFGHVQRRDSEHTGQRIMKMEAGGERETTEKKRKLGIG